MTLRSPHPRPGPEVHRVADVQLRSRAGSLQAHAYWPAPTEPVGTPALVVFFHGDGSAGALEPVEALCRGLCSRAGVVVLSVTCRLPASGSCRAALEDATTATQWAADHAAELSADPRRLVVAGQADGARLAATVALQARDEGWPPLARQVLIRPDLGGGTRSRSPRGEDRRASPLHAASLGGVAAATVVTVDRGRVLDDGAMYAGRLRRSGVDVDELVYPDAALGHLGSDPPGGTADRLLVDLGRSLRTTLGTPPTRPLWHRRTQR